MRSHAAPAVSSSSSTPPVARAAMGSTLLRSPSPRMPCAYSANDSFCSRRERCRPIRPLRNSPSLRSIASSSANAMDVHHLPNRGPWTSPTVSSHEKRGDTVRDKRHGPTRQRPTMPLRQAQPLAVVLVPVRKVPSMRELSIILALLRRKIRVSGSEITRLLAVGRGFTELRARVPLVFSVDSHFRTRTSLGWRRNLPVTGNVVSILVPPASGALVHVR